MGNFLLELGELVGQSSREVQWEIETDSGDVGVGQLLAVGAQVFHQILLDPSLHGMVISVTYSLPEQSLESIKLSFHKLKTIHL